VTGAKGGKLAGKRIGIKDNVCVAGIPMTCASRVLEGYVPDIDATIIRRILDAGGEITAILNMDNFAFSGGGDTSANRLLHPMHRQRRSTPDGEIERSQCIASDAPRLKKK
jgi:Asp-tRNA(Asn)/Glu-tRNA(Gln) amidotransferase A subunit family amidase